MSKNIKEKENMEGKKIDKLWHENVLLGKKLNKEGIKRTSIESYHQQEKELR